MKGTGWLIVALLLEGSAFAQVWQRQDSLGGVIYFTSVAFPTPSEGWAVGHAYPGFNVYHTDDGGATWNAHSFLTDGILRDVQFVNDSVGWMVSHRIAHTADGGAHWAWQDSSGSVHAVSFVDALTGWAVGEEGYIVHTTDAGANWLRQVADNRDLYDVDFATSEAGWAVGNGSLLRTTDGGETWVQQGDTIVGVGYSVFTVNANTAWVGCDRGILHTSDGGVTWATQDIGTDTLAIYGITFTDSLTGWAAGNWGCIFHTADGGQTWIRQISGINYPLYDLAFADSSHGWAVGFGGIVLRYSSGTWVSETRSETPCRFSLNAYPSPFNASTTISYDLPKTGHISLRVFDLLGREVAVLKDGLVEAGSHRAAFDGSALASGIYFARLEAGESVQTKKLMLLK